MKQEAYAAQLKAEQERGRLLARRYNQVSALRLVCFLLVLFCLCLAWFGGQAWGYAPAAALAAAFLGLMACHRRVALKQAYCAARRQVLQGLLACFDSSWHGFSEDGTAFLNEKAPRLEDLDVFGPRSLYQYLCAAGTPMGKRLLAEWLSSDPPEADELRARQKAVEELVEKAGFSLELRTLLHLLRNGNADLAAQEDFLQKAVQPGPPPSAASRVLMWGLPALTWVLLGLSLAGLIPALVSAAFLLLQLGLTLFSYTRHTGALSPLFSIERDLTEYEALFVLLEKTEFHSALLAGHRAHIAAGAAGGLKKLRTIGAAVRLRHNPVAYAVAASLLLWDHHCAAAFARWKQIYGASLRGWFEAVACLEACVSLQLPALVRENVCFPEIVDTDEPLFRAEGMRHPLLAETDAVPNDAGLAHGTVIITGSNMSGKTTFLRTIGLNMVLAYAGAPVCAAGLALSRMKLFTSMRVEDDVSRGISTFYAELLRIRAMVAYQKERKPMMALIDEIFKGTNSADRIVGATAAVKRLSSAWCLTLVSTHDFELCALESDPVIRARNFHFEESYQGDRICFDYRIKDGRCRTANARHLLRLVGILQDQPGQEGTG